MYSPMSGSTSGPHLHEEWCKTDAKSLPNLPGIVAPVASLATCTLMIFIEITGDHITFDDFPPKQT